MILIWWEKHQELDRIKEKKIKNKELAEL